MPASPVGYSSEAQEGFLFSEGIGYLKRYGHQKNKTMKDFETKLQAELDNLPFTQHLDDGQFNDGQIAGFEAGARWAESINSSENPDSSKAELIEFAMYLTGHNKQTIEQMYQDYKKHKK